MNPLEQLALRLHQWLVSRRRGVVAWTLCLLGLCAIGSARLRPRQDVLSLLGGLEGASYRDALEILARFGTLDVLMIDLSKADASREALEAGADALQASLEASGLFRRVVFRLDRDGMRGAFTALFEKRFGLFPPPADLAAAMEENRRDLVSPASMLMEGIVARDPLGHRRLLAERLRALAPRMRLDTSGGTLFSTDGRHALLIAEPLASGLDVEGAEAVLARIARETPPGFDAEVLGAHVFSAAAARSIRRDVSTAVTTTFVGILLLFFAYFVDVRTVVAANLPALGGGLVAAGVAGGLPFSLHGITFGFGAVMMGIGVDYGTHLLMHYEARRRGAPDETPRESMARTYGHVFGSIAMGATTTIATFVVLLASGTRVLTELAVFTGIGIAASFALAAVVLPLFPELVVKRQGRGPGRSPGLLSIGSRWPRPVLALALAVTAVLAPGLTSLRFDGSVRSLDYQPPEVRALEASFGERYANPRHPMLIVASGATREEAMTRSERVLELLGGAAAAGAIAAHTSPSELLPSERKQRETLSRYDPASLEVAVRDAALRAELDPALFAPFFEDLSRARSGAIPPLAPADLAGSPLAPVVNRALIERDGRTELLTLVNLAPGPGGDPRPLPPALFDALSALGVQVVSSERIANQTVLAIQRAVGRLSFASLALVALVLLLYYRRLAPLVFAMVPVAIGLVWTFGLMGLLDVPLNIVSVGALALVAGVGVDYGIFMTDAAVRAGPALDGAAPALDAALRSVTMGAVTTLVGFGALLLARSPVMWSLGFAVSAGITASFVAATHLLPAIWEISGRRGLAARTCPVCQVSLEGARLETVGLAALGLALAALAGASILGRGEVPNPGELAAVLAADVAAIAWLARRKPACTRCAKVLDG